MEKFKELQIKSLDNRLLSYKELSKPSEGWIRTIRKALSIPLSYLAETLNVSNQAIAQFEKSEIDETITLKSLNKVAQALNCRLHYVLMPEDKSLHRIIENRADIKAKQIVDEVDRSMSIEGQRVKDKEKSISILKKELIEHFNSKLWKDD
jgi:predicted DNA-binding mobile mystery protein A